MVTLYASELDGYAEDYSATYNTAWLGNGNPAAFEGADEIIVSHYLDGGIRYISRGMLIFDIPSLGYPYWAEIYNVVLYLYINSLGGAYPIRITAGKHEGVVSIEGYQAYGITQTQNVNAITTTAGNYATIPILSPLAITYSTEEPLCFGVRGYGDAIKSANVYTNPSSFGSGISAHPAYIEFDVQDTLPHLLVSGIRHTYRPGSYRAELTFGDISATTEIAKQEVVLPTKDTSETPSTAVVPEKTVPELIQALKADSAWPSSDTVTIKQTIKDVKTESSLWRRVTPWNEAAGETLGSEIAERFKSFTSWLKKKTGTEREK